MKYIKNNTLGVKTWLGTVVAAGTYYEIEESEQVQWANNSEVLIDIGNSDAIMAKTDDGTTDIIDINDAINFLKNNLTPEVSSTSYPFASKILPDGKKLFGRAHGKTFVLNSGANVLDFDIPYANCKITGVEIIGGEVGDTLDFFVLDDSLGTYSTIPDYPLNQFGFDVGISKDFYKRESVYDADLYYNMCISIAYYSQSAKTVYINYILHEVKD